MHVHVGPAAPGGDVDDPHPDPTDAGKIAAQAAWSDLDWRHFVHCHCQERGHAQYIDGSNDEHVEMISP
jgi:hypothetical protein